MSTLDISGWKNITTADSDGPEQAWRRTTMILQEDEFAGMLSPLTIATLCAEILLTTDTATGRSWSSTSELIGGTPRSISEKVLNVLENGKFDILGSEFKTRICSLVTLAILPENFGSEGRAALGY